MRAKQTLRRRETTNPQEALRPEGHPTVYYLLLGLFVWLFGVLVFIPLARSIGPETRIVVSLIFFAAFSVLMFKAVPRAMKMIRVLSSLLAYKYSSRHGLQRSESATLFQNLLLILSLVILYLLYVPFLSAFHPAISGMVLILALIVILLLTLRAYITLAPRLVEWLSSR